MSAGGDRLAGRLTGAARALARRSGPARAPRVRVAAAGEAPRTLAPGDRAAAIVAAAEDLLSAAQRASRE